MIKITKDEIVGAIAAAAPAKGESWEPGRVAEEIADLFTAEAEALQEWQAGRSELTVRFEPSEDGHGDANAVRARHRAAAAMHHDLIEKRILANKQIIAGIRLAVIGLGAAAITGGIASPALVPGLMSVAGQISSALNSEAA